MENVFFFLFRASTEAKDNFMLKNTNLTQFAKGTLSLQG
jgi:hypothetical protein